VAVWQVPIELIPSRWAKENNFLTDSLYDDEGYADVELAWKNNQPTNNIEAIFSNILSKGESWSEKLNLWGNTESTDISLWREGEKVESIRIRLDLRENVLSLMVGLVSAATELECVLFIPGQKIIIQPNISDLKQAVLKSNAAKFVEDPVAFLESVEID